MKKKRKPLVEWQSVPTDPVSGCPDSYDNYVVAHENTESVLANPDSLPEQDNKPSTPQLIMGEAIQHLQGRQKEVYLLMMRENKSFGEAAEILGITKSSAQVYLDRAIKFIGAYCKVAIAKERI